MQKVNRREVCLVYGVPPWMVSPEEDTWQTRLWWRTRWPRLKWRKVKRLVVRVVAG